MTLPYKRIEVKDRVRATWKGACNVTLPSFTLRFDALNEKAIAHDIRRGAEMGFWGTLIASESGTTFREYCQFMEIAAAAAPKGFALVTHLSFDTFEEMIEAAKLAETLGFEGALASYPPSFRPTSAAEIVSTRKSLPSRRIRAHSVRRANLGLQIFTSERFPAGRARGDGTFSHFRKHKV